MMANLQFYFLKPKKAQESLLLFLPCWLNQLLTWNVSQMVRSPATDESLVLMIILHVV